MDSAIENANLDPPPPRHILLRGLPIAVLAHVGLAVALTWGVQWRRLPDVAHAPVPLPPVAAETDTSTSTMGAPPAPASQPVQRAPAARR
ncbi:hypothetical protein [Ramlibacter humi]|uniref:Uncharacterized protein n=1 Tax=Ramlibacter humi TaxID=2530451 RepID=A0A4Z0BJ84_9BURK|nr:hypothetical protein [Ramlibacter humi]TFY98327.1 hypothetical protein EZ216_17220 [Ramlibacter humi]